MNFQKIVVNFLTIGALFSLFSIFLLMLLAIIGRSLLGTGFVGINEILLFSQLNLTFLTLPILFIRNEHIKVDYFLNKLPLSIHKIINKLITLLSVIFALVFIYSHFTYLKLAWNIVTPILNIPNVIYYLGSLVGMMLLVIFGIMKLFSKV